MKAILFATFVALLMVGCGGPDLDDKETLVKVIAEAIDGDTLQLRGKEGEKKLAHAPNQETPYTGWVKEMYDNGQIKVLMQVEGGKTLTIVSWKPNGEKCLDTNLVNGNGVVVLYNDDGGISSLHLQGRQSCLRLDQTDAVSVRLALPLAIRFWGLDPEMGRLGRVFSIYCER